MTRPTTIQPTSSRNRSTWPPGLECLASVDHILVDQQIEWLEVITGWETNNRYVIRNNRGDQLYFALEDNDCCTLYCCGAMRPFDMSLIDNNHNEVIHFHRYLRCQNCCCPCCLQTLEVYAPPGNMIGVVEQDWSIWRPKFTVKNSYGDTILKIKGPCCTIQCCCDIEFKVMSKDGFDQVGRISKHWAGFVREMFTAADIYGITFPMDLDVKSKAVMIGASILIDYMYYENDESGFARDLNYLQSSYNTYNRY